MLALIAGQGALPGAVAAALDSPPLVCALEGFEPDALKPDLVFRLETLGSLLETLLACDVTTVCMCGTIRRPAIDPAALDAPTRALLPVLTEALRLGDDGALRAIIGIFEEAGLKVIGAHEAAPALLLPAGVPSHWKPGLNAARDAELGDLVSAEQATRDLGQACVIRNFEVLAREGVAGTAAMLGSVTDAEGGIFYKAEKPGQERRVDLPVIGPETVAQVVAAGLDGIVISAGGVMVLGRAATLAALDDAGKFLWVRDRAT